ncbi:hypothetical protein [Acidimangrovimonas sediminis]|uniref:hypothetical protein n=1 Tax=Acidimangrovimonas sediminis TaxID=2056283 RepID=UPI001304C298|nr:hypothetical protein [Acidimangrovimonas sediminis]
MRDKPIHIAPQAPQPALPEALRQEIASMSLARDLERLAQKRLERTRQAGDE